MLAAHYNVGAAVGFSDDNAYFGHRGLGVGIDKLGPMANDPPMLLLHSGHEPRHVHQRNQGDVEAVAKTDEPGCFGGGVDVQYTGQVIGLVAHDAHGTVVEPAEAHHHVGRKALVDLHEVLVVHDAVNDVAHVVGTVGIVGHQVA